jgi:hypothetical protein
MRNRALTEQNATRLRSGAFFAASRIHAEYEAKKTSARDLNKVSSGFSATAPTPVVHEPYETLRVAIVKQLEEVRSK